MSTKPRLTQPQNQMEEATCPSSSAKASVNAEGVCLVTGANMLVCGGPTVGNNAKVLYWAWSSSLSSSPFYSQQLSFIQMGTEIKCASSTYTVMEKWDFSHYSYGCAAIIFGKDSTLLVVSAKPPNVIKGWKLRRVCLLHWYLFGKKLVKSNTAQSWK